MQSLFAGMRGVVSALPEVKAESPEPKSVLVTVYYRALPKKGIVIPTSKQTVTATVPLLIGWSRSPELKAAAEAVVSKVATDKRNEFVAKYPTPIFSVEIERDTVQTTTRVEFGSEAA